MGGMILMPSEVRRGYEIVRELNRGQFAIAYEAKKPSGEKVFFKQYKSPTPLVAWYEGFVEHQQELKRRINGDASTKDKCYRFIEFFEEKSGFFQVFEFISEGMTLGDCIEKRSSFSWTQLVVFSRVMMLGIKALHQVKVVHTDLKPPNIMLLPDRDIDGYRLRLVDLDWSVFTDTKAPWHGVQGYIGSPGYMSPEHVLGEVPLPASDIFTCGLMLGEVLGGRHPFEACLGDDTAYREAILAGRHDPVRLLSPIERCDTDYVELMLNACLDPKPERRPTAQQLTEALLGTAKVESKKPPPEPVRKPEVKIPAPAPSLATSVTIDFEGQAITTLSIDDEIGKRLFRNLHADAQFLSDPQFKLLKRSGGWFIEHCASATNETIVDGKKLLVALPVRDGMRVAVGNSAKGIEKFPLHLKLRL